MKCSSLLAASIILFAATVMAYGQKLPPGGYQNKAPSFSSKPADSATVKTGEGTAEGPTDELNKMLSEDQAKVPTTTTPQTKPAVAQDKSPILKPKSATRSSAPKTATVKKTPQHKAAAATPGNRTAKKASKRLQHKHHAAKKSRKAKPTT